jgi:hypothetical protein
MPTVRFEPVTFGASQPRGGVPPSTIAGRGLPVNYTPTGVTAVAYGPVAGPQTVLVKNFGGGIYLNAGPTGVTAGALVAGTGYNPANGYEILSLAAGDSIAVLAAELT